MTQSVGSNRNSPVRTFIAIDTPAKLKETIANLQRDLSRLPGHKIAWPRMEGIHLTLRFLGDVERPELETLLTSVKETVANFQCFTLKTTVTGGFPNLQRPRILWLGLNEEPELIALQVAVEQTCIDLGFPPDDKRFHPHLTVGRVKEIERNCTLTNRFGTTSIQPVEWDVKEVKIMSSELRPSGAFYGVLSSAPLL